MAFNAQLGNRKNGDERKIEIQLLYQFSSIFATLLPIFPNSRWFHFTINTYLSIMVRSQLTDSDVFEIT